MSKRFIGSSVTDSNGRATLPYTGSGRGLVDFVAEVEVDDSTLSSEIYEVLDCMYIDTGIDTFVGSTLRCNYETLSNGRKVTATGNGGHLFLKSNSRNFDFPLIVEIDVISIEKVSGVGIDVYDGSNEKRIWLNEIGSHKFQIDSNGVTNLTSLNITQTGSNMSSSPIRMSVYGSATGDAIIYANLKVYPI